MVAKFDAYGTICSIAFIIFIIDALKQRAASTLLTKFATI
jgi:hypothetical protein